MVHNWAMLLLPIKFVCSAVFESVQGDSLTQRVKMRFIIMIDSKPFLLSGREGNFRGSTHCLAAFNLLVCLASTKGLFPCSGCDTAHQCDSLDPGLLLITYKCVSGLDLSPECSSI